MKSTFQARLTRLLLVRLPFITEKALHHNCAAFKFFLLVVYILSKVKTFLKKCDILACCHYQKQI